MLSSKIIKLLSLFTMLILIMSFTTACLTEEEKAEILAHIASESSQSNNKEQSTEQSTNDSESETESSSPNEYPYKNMEDDIDTLILIIGATLGEGGSAHVKIDEVRYVLDSQNPEKGDVLFSVICDFGNNNLVKSVFCRGVNAKEPFESTITNEDSKALDEKWRMAKIYEETIIKIDEFNDYFWGNP